MMLFDYNKLDILYINDTIKIWDLTNPFNNLMGKEVNIPTQI